MPRPAPHRVQNGQNGPKQPWSPSPSREPSSDDDLAARLNVLAGGSIADIAPSEDLVIEYNQIFANATHQRFEHRTLLGLVINALRPAHGQVAEFNEHISQRIGRGVRWVQDTASVAETIRTAIAEGVTLPLEIREVYWRKVPAAVENIRQGRPLDFSPRKSKVEPTPEEKAQAVAKALTALTGALDAIDSAEQRQALAAGVIEAMRAYCEADSAPEPEPPGPEPPSPEPRTPTHPQRPDRDPRPARPDRPGRRRR